jgi:NAD(P)-dependent dehydrogenase (short-subunit alcohol dehydrogenase family)
LVSTILVIGASRGIGFELARQYLAAGDRVIATVRSEAAAGALRDLGAEVLTVDVARSDSVSGLAWQLDGEKLDSAWYVAGVMDRANALSPPTQQDFDHVMHTNVLGAMQVLPQVAPLVEAAQGRFAFISSAMGQIAGVASSYSWTYRVSKAALNMAVASARQDYPQAVLVAMSPGWVQTDMGGAGAPLTVEQSAGAMRAALARLTRADSGAFVDMHGKRFEGW